MISNLRDFLRENKTVFLVGVFFMVAISYQYIVVPFQDDADSSKSTQEAVESLKKVADIDSDYPEKMYSGVIDTRNGDAYRIGARVYSEKETVLEILLHSDFEGEFKVGEWTVPASQAGIFKEIVFKTPSRFTNVIVRLKSNVSHHDTSWKRNAIFLDSFFVTRLDTKIGFDIASLGKTEYAVAGITPARLEDTGQGWLYEASLTKGDQLSLDDLFVKTEGIFFDEKKGLISGARKKGEYFTYKFDMKHSFNRLALEAEQAGESPKEITMEYSLDGVTWKQVDYTQKKGEAQKFHVVLSDVSNQGVIFIRVVYIGKEKQKGSFALKELTLKALLSR